MACCAPLLQDGGLDILLCCLRHFQIESTANPSTNQRLWIVPPSNAFNHVVVIIFWCSCCWRLQEQHHGGLQKEGLAPNRHLICWQFAEPNFLAIFLLTICWIIIFGDIFADNLLNYKFRQYFCWQFAECKIFLLTICWIHFFGDIFADNLLNPIFLLKFQQTVIYNRAGQ